jgi:type IV pilus assembly protein PilV
MKTMHRIHAKARQQGVMLLEALIALLIFAIGILAIVGMQATAIQDLSESKYRTDAAFLANQVVADMWVNSRQLAAYQYGGSGAVPALIQPWVNTVQARLPGSNVHGPIIRLGANNTVTVTVRWQQARDGGGSTPPHSYTTVAYINCFDPLANNSCL